MNRFFPFIVIPLLVIACGNSKNTDDALLSRALKLHAEMVTIDTHTDTPLNFLRTGFDFSGENNTARGSKVDLKKMEEGKRVPYFFALLFTTQ